MVWKIGVLDPEVFPTEIESKESNMANVIERAFGEKESPLERSSKW